MGLWWRRLWRRWCRRVTLFVRGRAGRLAAWTLLVIAAIAALMLYVWALWQAPDRMHLHSPQNRYNARLLVISVGGAVVVGVGLLYTARSYRLSHRGQITDRFTRALEQLTAEQLYVRVGGVQALARLMQDSPIHHDDIIEVLASFIRDRTLTTARSAGGSETVRELAHLPEALPAHPAPPADVQAALTALAHRPQRPERRSIALAGTDLTGADLGGANLVGADLVGAELGRVNLQGADLTGANLRTVQLNRADLTRAALTGANLSAANLTAAELAGADLTCAYAYNADFTDANLARADLKGANLSIANLTHAYLFGANLSHAYLRLANLADADLTGANFQDVRGLLGDQLQQARTDASVRLQGKYDRPRWHRTPARRDAT
jgi:uncharacterized protein YjbI with pentapeptide repeats